MMTTCTPAIAIFRTTAAIHGLSPEHTTTSMAHFAFYYSCPVLARYDPKTKQYIESTISYNGKLIRDFYLFLFVTGLMVSMYDMHPHIFPPISTSGDADKDWSCDWNSQFANARKLLWDNLLHSALFQCYLTTFAKGLMVLKSALTGIETKETMNNPVFGSTSPSDFWSRRWNLLIHDVLKRGVYLPVKQQFSNNARTSSDHTDSGGNSMLSGTTLALTATFFASGLFHEWLQVTVFPSWDHYYESQNNSDGDDNNSICRIVGRHDAVSPLHCYTPRYGLALAFFMWQAMLIAVEFALRPYLSKNNGFLLGVPAPIKTLCTVLAGGCVAHWFTEPYIHSNFFRDVESGIFLWKIASSSTNMTAFH